MKVIKNRINSYYNAIKFLFLIYYYEYKEKFSRRLNKDGHNE